MLLEYTEELSYHHGSEQADFNITILTRLPLCEFD